MKNLGRKTERIIVSSLLPFAFASAQATESLVCGNGKHSIQVLCGSEGCDSFNLYVGSAAQSVASWQVVRSDIDEKKETINFKAVNPARPSESVELSATRRKGVLRVSNRSRSVKCDWSAFEL